jgi:hypothetical protein
MSGHVDQTMTEISASGGAYRDYLRVTRPAVARQMRAFGLEFEFCAAERDKLLRGIELAPVQRVSKVPRVEARRGPTRLYRFGTSVAPVRHSGTADIIGSDREFDLFAIDSLCRCGFTPSAGRSPFEITPDSS